jgi:HlyD family secretion protein
MEKSKKKKLFIFLGVFLVLAIIIGSNLKKSGQGKVRVQTEKVAKGNITATVSGSAKIQPEVQVKISAQVSGQIVRLGVQEGDAVRKGQFLVQLDPEYYKAALEQNESNLRFANAGFEKAKNEYERSKELFSKNLISLAELDIAKSTYEQAKAQVEQSDAALKQSRDNLAKTTMFSPMDGTVSQLNKKAGEMAMGSQFTLDVIMVVADLNKMWAETEIDENDVVSVSLGDTAKISIDAFPDSTFRGLVKEIANTGVTRGSGTQEEVTNFLVKVTVIDRLPGLRPSMSANVDILTETKAGVLKIPIQCVTVRSPLKPEAPPGEKKKAEKGVKEEETKEAAKPDSTGKTEPAVAGKESKKEESVRVVFIVKDKVARQISVETGISSETEWEIVKGLNEGDEVVSGSFKVLSKQLKDGDPVVVDNSVKTFGQENREQGDQGREGEID